MIWQRTGRHQMEQLIRSAKTEYPVSEDYLERVTAAVANAPAPPMARSRRRLIAVTVGAAVALFALGFVPIPMGKAPGALERAIAALSGAPSVHMVARGWSGGNYYRFEAWNAPDGSTRYEQWRNGTLWELMITRPEWALHYDADSSTAWESDMPPIPDLRFQISILPDASTRTGLQKTLSYVQEALHGRVTERRERSLWGGAIDVIEAQCQVHSGWVISGVPYDSDGVALVQAEVDPGTNETISLREYKQVGSRWELLFETELIEWDVETPESLWTFEPPPGTKLTRHTWWTGRADAELAVAYSADWEVVLHAIDVNHTGETVVLTISRWMSEGSDPDLGARPQAPEVEAVDSSGSSYSQDPGMGCVTVPAGGYWVRTLHRQGAAPGFPPRAMTVTIGSQSEAEAGHPPVTFRNIPLPPRQSTDDLFAAETEVIQY